MGQFDSIVIGFILITAFILGGTLMINDLDEGYDDVDMSGATDDFADVFNTMGNIRNLSKEIKESTIDADISKDESDMGSISSMTRGAYSAVRLIGQTFGLFENIINAIGQTMGLNCNALNPADKNVVCSFIDFAFVAFTVMILFGIIYMVFRYVPI